MLDVLGTGSSTGDLLARGRAWTLVGCTLVQTSVSLVPTQSRSDPALDLGRDVLEHAHDLFDAAAGESAHRHPDAVTALLGRAEVALRQGDEQAVRLAGMLTISRKPC